MEQGVRCKRGHKVNDARMFQGAECPRTCECGDVICSKGCTCCRCAVLPSLNMERESCGVPMQTEGGMG